MTDLRRVELDRREGGVAVVTMRDAGGRNAMSERFVADLLAALRDAEAWSALKVVVLAGLPDVFSSGASLDMLVRLARGEIAPTDILLAKVLLDMPVPVVAAMEGHAIGGGLALGLAADVVMIARESRYGASFMNMGFTPGMGITKLLEHVVAPAVAREMLFTGEPKKGSFFEGKSGFNAILPKAEVMPRAMAMASRIADKPRISLEILKRSLTMDRRRAFETTHTVESLMHRVSLAQPEIAARIEEHMTVEGHNAE
ncbi:MAG: polyketide synthase [Polyangiaceae bacterium]|nr:polyketide synthase [Polyangiaceae bacterium]